MYIIIYFLKIKWKEKLVGDKNNRYHFNPEITGIKWYPEHIPYNLTMANTNSAGCNIEIHKCNIYHYNNSHYFFTLNRRHFALWKDAYQVYRVLVFESYFSIAVILGVPCLKGFRSRESLWLFLSIFVWSKFTNSLRLHCLGVITWLISINVSKTGTLFWGVKNVLSEHSTLWEYMDMFLSPYFDTTF